MDLKAYYRRVRELEASLPDEFLVVKSISTEAGGVDGRLTEVSRPLAAKLLAEELAELASADEAKEFRKKALAAQQAELERREAARIQFHVISESDLGSLRGPRNRTKD